ncbi:flavin reductase [Bradyrhizobium sp. 2TAF36]|uniref:flavin reductase n=1 Tax=Bradyrhizobium sp. 2TAF36 TaxID=3233016 RepID=UPI003F8FBF09
MQTIDPKHFPSVMDAFPTGVAIIATEWAGKLFGATINSLIGIAYAVHAFCSLPTKAARRGMAILKRGLFSVNILGQHKSDLSARFTGKRRAI